MPNYVGVTSWDVLGGNKPSQSELRKLIKYIDPVNLIKLACQLNMATYCFSGTLKQRPIIGQLMNDGLIDTNSALILDNQKSWTFTRPGLLELMRAAACLSTGKSSIRSRQKEFAKAILHAFEIYNHREADPIAFPPKNVAMMSPNERETYYRSFAYLMFALFKSHNSANPAFALARGTNILVKDFFRNSPAHTKCFEDETKMTLQEYFDSLAFLTTQGLETKSQSFKDMYVIDLTKLTRSLSVYGESALKKFLKLESQDAVQMARNLACNNIETDFFDKKKLRERPIFHAGPEQYVVIDEVFFTDRAKAGAFFHTLGKSHSQTSFGKLGEAGERYVNRIVEEHSMELNAAGSTQIWIANPLFKSGGEICDTCVIKSKKIAICETKHVLLRADLLDKKDAIAFWEAVKSNYACERMNNGKLKRYGTHQLHHAIMELMKGSPAADARVTFSDKEEVFPVLFAHDELISAPFFSHCLGLEFMHLFGEDELPKCGQFKPNGTLIVHAPIVVSVTELEQFYSLQGVNELTDFLSRYSAAHPDRIESFGDFLSKLNLASRTAHFVYADAIAVLNDMDRRMYK